MTQGPHKPEDWNPGVQFGLGLTLVIGCLPGWIPGLPRNIWLMGVLLGLPIMAHAAKPFYLEQRKRWKGNVKKMILLYAMIACGVGFIGFGTSYLRSNSTVTSQNIQGQNIGKDVTVSGSKIILHDLFKSDLNGRSYNFLQGIDQKLFVNNATVTVPFEVGIYGDFISRSLFMGVYLPASNNYQELLIWMSTGYKDYLYDAKTNTHIWIPAPADTSEPISDDLEFTKQIYIYHENVIPDKIRFQLEVVLRAAGLEPTFRGWNYLMCRREHGPAATKRLVTTTANLNDEVPPVFTPDPSNEINPTLLTLFMTDFKGDGKGLKAKGSTEILLETTVKHVRLKVRVFYNVYYNKTASSIRMSLYVPLFQFPQQIIDYSACQITKWMDEAKKGTLSNFPSATWINDAKFNRTIYLYSQTSLSDEALTEIKNTFGKYGLNIQSRGDEYWFHRVAQARDNTAPMPPKYVLVDGMPQLQDAHKDQPSLPVPTSAPPALPAGK